ncbi:OmpA family protein [Chromobacterium haemolyticum]|uniref:OmpA family protein n=2 Tax=Chromobacterium fluminis TaxID=3044269 RepID=A0ABX0LBC3_9NEIS|nr:OmpA family protein [Chromobacterium haemolyticum]
MAGMANKPNREHEAAVIKKVSRRQDSEGHGGAWKVAFADFVLALMCLFLVLWVLAARDQENLQQLLTAGGGSPLKAGGSRSIEHTGTPPGSLIPRDPIPGQPTTTTKADSMLQESNKVAKKTFDGQGQRSLDSVADLEKLAGLLAKMSQDAGLASNLQTVVTPYGLRVMLHDTDNQGMFERGSAIVEPRFKRLLHDMGDMFSHIDNQLLIVGHTDAAQYRTAGFGSFSNWGLSSNRAMAARLHLLEGGMNAAGILQVVGMADRAPLDVAHPLAAYNRRIELLVMTSKQAQAVVAMFGPPGQSGNRETSVVSSPLQKSDLDSALQDGLTTR